MPNNTSPNGDKIFKNSDVGDNRAGKNVGSGQFGFGQIGLSDQDFVPGPYSDYKSDIQVRPEPEPECPMSGPDCPNIRICVMIFGHSN